jgi:flavin reductase (DIM6/NTAB) family NADH-FMN oxidoreductase RutF
MHILIPLQTPRIDLYNQITLGSDRLDMNRMVIFIRCVSCIAPIAKKKTCFDTDIKEVVMSDDLIKEVLRRIPYGFYAITSKHGDEVNAMTANWITQASFEPRLIACAIQKTCFSYELIKGGGVFAINLFLGKDMDSIKPFTKGRSKNPDKMKDVKFTPGPITGCPILQDSAAYLECKVKEIFETDGDHNLILGEVVNAGILKPGEVNNSLTLMDLGWSYAG